MPTVISAEFEESNDESKPEGQDKKGIEDTIDGEIEVVSDERLDEAIDLESEGPEFASLVEQIQRAFLNNEIPKILNRLQAEAVENKNHTHRIGRFEVIKKIGEGRFGIVLLVNDPVLKCLRALKIPLPDTLASTDALSRFLLEGQRASRIDCEYVIRVHEAASNELFPYILMGYCSGGSLRSWLTTRAGQGLPPDWVAKFVMDIARGVKSAHAAGLLHRDIKPENILLEWRSFDKRHDLPIFRPKLTDFGLAKAFDLVVLDYSNTLTGTTMGSWNYMSPEQAEGVSDLTPATDIYSIGSVLFELLTGARLYGGLNEFQIGKRLSAADPTPTARSFRPDIDRDLDMICARCLDKNREDRYQSADDLIHALERYLDGQPTIGRRLCWRRVKRAATRSQGVRVTAAWVILGSVILWNYFSPQPPDRPQLIPERPQLIHVPAELYRAYLEEPYASPIAARVAILMLRDSIATPDEAPSLVDALATRALECEPSELREITDTLNQVSGQLQTLAIESFWAGLRSTWANSAQRMRAASALAALDPQSRRWSGWGDRLVVDLLQAAGDEEKAASWAKLLVPVRSVVTERLCLAASDVGAEKAVRLRACWLLSELLSEDPSKLAVLLLNAEEFQLKPLARNLRTSVVVEEKLRLVLEQNTSPLHDYLAEKDRLAKKRANAAVGLFRLGYRNLNWSRFLDPDDPAPCTYLIERLKLADVDPFEIYVALWSYPARVRQTLILALGEYERLEFNSLRFRDVISGLFDKFEAEPDAGVHMAIQWLLRHWNMETQVVEAIDRILAKPQNLQGRNWWIDTQRVTYSVIEAGKSFGCLTSDFVSDSPTKNWYKDVLLDYSFALATLETTSDQFYRFLAEDQVDIDRVNKIIANRNGLTFLIINQKPNLPVHSVSYQLAVRFCNWRSKVEGIPEDQWCYEPIINHPDGFFREKSGYLKLKGYRLPTHEEWMYGCRQEGRSPYSFGHTPEKSPLFCWTRENSDLSPQLGGRKFPNALGLHDMHGNVFELCSLPEDLDLKLRENRTELLGSHCHGPNLPLNVTIKLFSTPQNYPNSLAGFRLARTIDTGDMVSQDSVTTRRFMPARELVVAKVQASSTHKD